MAGRQPQRHAPASTAPPGRPASSSTSTCIAWRPSAGITAGSARLLDLFHFQEEAGGFGVLASKGWILYRAVEAYVRRLDAAGYVEVRTPQLLDRTLWEASGHWEKFGEHMFVLEAEHKTLALKPMNCPAHVQIFNQRLHSYRDLPLRMAGVRVVSPQRAVRRPHGLMRVRAFTQDDAHIFCTPEQITAETIGVCDLLKSIYRDFGFTDVFVRFADRPPVRAGDEIWDRAELALKGRRRLQGSIPSSIPAKARSMGQNWSSSCAMRSAASGSAAPIRSTSCCPSASTPATSARTWQKHGR